MTNICHHMCFLCDVQEKKRKASSQGQGRMYVAKDESAAAAFNQGRSMQGLQEVPLGQRAMSTSGRDGIVTARCVPLLLLDSLLPFRSRLPPSTCPFLLFTAVSLPLLYLLRPVANGTAPDWLVYMAKGSFLLWVGGRGGGGVSTFQTQRVTV